MTFIWNTHFPMSRVVAFNMVSKTRLLIASEHLCYHTSHACVSGPRSFFQESGYTLRFTEAGFQGRHRLNQIRRSLDYVLGELRAAYVATEETKDEREIRNRRIRR
jgi:hypothetical protein